jgi:acetyltransferase-like isoleucine patch superfamily enzyme
MPYLSQTDLKQLNFKHIGRNVQISSDARLYSPETIIIGDNSRVDDFAVLSGNVTIGRNVHITLGCNIAGGEPGVFIADFCTIAYYCQILSQSDDYSGETMTNSTIPKQYKNEIKEAVRLERHVIVGTSSVIMPGVIIAEGGSIGALSFVNKSTLPWKIYVGSPARPIKDRSRRLLDLEQSFLKSEE